MTKLHINDLEFYAHNGKKSWTNDLIVRNWRKINYWKDNIQTYIPVHSCLWKQQVVSCLAWQYSRSPAWINYFLMFKGESCRNAKKPVLYSLIAECSWLARRKKGVDWLTKRMLMECEDKSSKRALLINP